MLKLMVRHGLLALATGALVLGTACGDDDGTNGTSVGEASAALTAAESCDDLKGYITSVALAELDKAELAYTLGRGMDDGAFAESDSQATSGAGASDPAPAEPASDTNSGTDGPSHSGTNVQVEGVDEADVVKTDGNTIYALTDGTLRIVKSHPASDTELLASLALDGYARELFLHGDRVVVFSQDWGNWYGGEVVVSTSPSAPPEGGSDGGGEAGADVPFEEPVGPTSELRGEVLRVTVIDVSDPRNPVVVRTVAIEGGYVSARMVGDNIYTVARARLFLPEVPWYVYGGYAADGGVGIAVDGTTNTTEPVPADEAPSGGEAGSDDGGSSGSGEASDDENDSTEVVEPPPGDDADPIDPEVALERFKAEYATALAEGSLEDWLPRVADSVSGTTSPAQLTTCTNFYKPSIQLGLGVVTVVTLDLGTDDAPVGATSTLGESHTVYASSDAIYSAAYVYDYWFWRDATEDDGEYTQVHRFDYAGGDVSYRASGKVPGQLLNQFSMDQHEGHLRVATTSWNWATDRTSDNGVYVLATDGQRLDVVGSATGLGAGEQIYSVRFLGDRGFVVTFRRTDPLYALDLSVPTAPAVKGELKIPGFSTYMHPLDANHLLTIGREAEDNGNWVEIQGVQVQVFDIADLSDPKLVHKETFGTSGTHSEALYDHRAFTFLPDSGLLAIPYQQWGWSTGGVPVPEPATPSSDGGGDSDAAADPIDPEEPPPEEVPDDGGRPAAEDYGFEAGVMVFRVDVASGIETFGTIDHTDLGADQPEWAWRGIQVLRTVAIEEDLFSVSTAGVKVNAIADLAEVAAVSFPPPEGYGYGYDDVPTTPAGDAGAEPADSP